MIVLFILLIPFVIYAEDASHLLKAPPQVGESKVFLNEQDTVESEKNLIDQQMEEERTQQEILNKPKSTEEEKEKGPKKLLKYPGYKYNIPF